MAEAEESFLAAHKTVGPNHSLVSEDGFIGVDPMYQNYANETEAPLQADEGPDKELEDKVMDLADEAAAAAEEAPPAPEAPKHAAPAPAAPSTDDK